MIGYQVPGCCNEHSKQYRAFIYYVVPVRTTESAYLIGVCTTAVVVESARDVGRKIISTPRSLAAAACCTYMYVIAIVGVIFRMGLMVRRNFLGSQRLAAPVQSQNGGISDPDMKQPIVDRHHLKREPHSKARFHGDEGNGVLPTLQRRWCRLQ